MILAATVRFGHDEDLILAQQLGADGVVVHLSELIADAVAAAEHRAQISGLRLLALEIADPDAAPADNASSKLFLPKSADTSAWSAVGKVITEAVLSPEGLAFAANKDVDLVSLGATPPLGQGEAWLTPQLLILRSAGYMGPVRPHPADPAQGSVEMDRAVSDLGYLRAALQTVAA